MPLYAYKCASGHVFESLVKMNLSDEPTRCVVLEDPRESKTACSAPVERQLSSPAKLFPGADSWRK